MNEGVNVFYIRGKGGCCWSFSDGHLSKPFPGPVCSLPHFGNLSWRLSRVTKWRVGTLIIRTGGISNIIDSTTPVNRTFMSSIN